MPPRCTLPERLVLALVLALVLGAAGVPAQDTGRRPARAVAPPPLVVAEPVTRGFPRDLPDRIRALLEAAVREHAFPCAVAAVARGGALVAEVAVGRETFADDAPAIGPDALFDLASLTKVCATTPAVLRLCAEGRLALDRPVAELLPELTGGGRERVTLRHLLTHSAGLPAFRPFHRELTGRTAILDAALDTPLESPPGTRYRYSDIGMMLAMAAVERATGEPFEAVVEREVLAPLGMRRTTFARTGTPIAAVPTEDCPWRGRVVRGEVHDENAFAMGGVSGHAGLFAPARDVVRLAHAFLGKAPGWLPADLLAEAVRRQDVVPGSSRALGWDTFVPGGSGGSKLDAEAFGHTGFTGTSVWCEPRRELVIVLLSNRVHPTRDNGRHGRVRRELADLVVGLLER